MSSETSLGNMTESKKTFDGLDYQYNEAPPPSFAESQAQNGAQHLTSEKPSGSSQTYPVQPFHTPAPARTLLTRYTNWAGSHISLADGDESKPLLRADLKMTKPQMTFKSATNESTLATINFYTFSTKIDATINGDTLTLTSPGFKDMLALYSFASAAEPGSTFMWKGRKSSTELNCEDQSGLKIARFKYGGIRKRHCRLEILAPRAASGRLLDEVVVTGIAMAHLLVFISIGTVAAGAS